MKSNVVKLIPRDDSVVTYAVRQIPIDRIRAFAGQPRKYFDAEEITARAESMKLLGQQDPVTVEPVVGDPDHDFELINGESRLRSAREAGIITLWAAVRSVPFGSKVEKHLASLVANFNRSDHTPMEISNALHVQMTEGGKSGPQIALALGKSTAWVYMYLRLQNLLPEFKKLLHPALPKDDRLATATAFELARQSADRQREILHKVRGEGRQRRVLRHKIRHLLRMENPTEPVPKSEHDNSKPWTLEREARYQELHRHDPKAVARRRAGIAELRALLETRRSR